MDEWCPLRKGDINGTPEGRGSGRRPSQVVKQLDQYNPAARFFHYDARGHRTLQTDSSGNIAEQYEYDAFGYPYFFNATGTNLGYSPWGNRFLFTGREWLSDLKLYDYRNRLYQPELGRFLQPDPKHFAAGDYNLYRYCHNDPVNKADSFGLQDYKPVNAFSRDGEYETVRFTTWARPSTGTNLRKELHWEVKREQHNVDHAYKDNQLTPAVTTAASGTSGNSITWHIKVEYDQKDFGPRWMAFAREKEHEHADWILDYAKLNATIVAATNAFQQGRLDSAAHNLLHNKMAHEEFLDKFTGRHALEENGQVLPYNQ